LLASQDKVSFTGHALNERMGERGIRPKDVRQILMRGDIDGDGRKSGEWKRLVVGKLDWTPREAGVATVVVRKDRLIIVTVEWTDP